MVWSGYFGGVNGLGRRAKFGGLGDLQLNICFSFVYFITSLNIFKPKCSKTTECSYGVMETQRSFTAWTQVQFLLGIPQGGLIHFPPAPTGCGLVVRRLLWEQEVVGSIPATPTTRYVVELAYTRDLKSLTCRFKSYHSDQVGI